MSCHGVSKYKQSVKSLVTIAMQYPKLHYSNLNNFRTFLTGYFVAYSELENIEDKDSFNTCFNEWLCCKTDSSGSSGWESVINQLANKIGVDPEALFFKYAQEFLEQWGTES